MPPYRPRDTQGRIPSPSQAQRGGRPGGSLGPRSVPARSPLGPRGGHEPGEARPEEGKEPERVGNNKLDLCRADRRRPGEADNAGGRPRRDKIVTTLIGMVGAVVGGSSWAYSAAAGRRGSTSGRSWWPRWGPSYCSASTGSSWVAGLAPTASGH